MPFIQPANSPAEALSNSVGALFQDPSRLAQAQYAGAHARHSEAQTQQLNQQNIARHSMGQAIQSFSANPNPQSMGDLVSTSLAAGYTPEQVIRGGLAAHQLAGSPGGRALDQQIIDTVRTTATGGDFAGTQTGFQQSQQNAIQRAQIAVGPDYARVGLERQKAGASNVYQLANGNVVVVPLGANPPEGALPMSDATSRVNTQTAAGPAYMQQNRENRAYGDTPQAYIDPETGETTYRQPGGPLPPSGSMPALQGASILSSTIASQPARIQQARETEMWKNTPRTYNNGRGQTYSWRPGDPNPPDGFLPVEQGAPAMSSVLTAPPRVSLVPGGNSNSGFTTQWTGPGQLPAPGAVPLDPQSPQNSIGLAGLFASTPPGAQPAAALPPAPVAAPPDSGLGSVIAPASAPAPVPAPPAADAGPARGPAQTKPLANRLMGGVAPVTPESLPPAAYKAINAQIDASVKRYNETSNKGWRTGLTGDYQLDEDAHSEIFARAAELARTQGPTASNYPAAVQQAWTELSPRFDPHGQWAPGAGPSLLRLRPAQPQQPGATPAPTPAPPQAPQAPAPGATMSSLLAPVEPGTPMVTPPGTAQAQLAPPTPPNPADRRPGQVYTSLDGRTRGLWTGSGWAPAP
jgi:hypothetical protein